jgi:hypothetical protein
VGPAPLRQEKNRSPSTAVFQLVAGGERQGAAASRRFSKCYVNSSLIILGPVEIFPRNFPHRHSGLSRYRRLRGKGLLGFHCVRSSRACGVGPGEVEARGGAKCWLHFLLLLHWFQLARADWTER